MQYYRLEGSERQKLLDHAVSAAEANASVECVLTIQLMVEYASGCLDVDHSKHYESIKGMATAVAVLDNGADRVLISRPLHWAVESTLGHGI